MIAVCDSVSGVLHYIVLELIVVCMHMYMHVCRTCMCASCTCMCCACTAHMCADMCAVRACALAVHACVVHALCSLSHMTTESLNS